MLWQTAQQNEHNLAANKQPEPLKAGISEAIGMEPDTEQVHTKPGEARDDVAEDGHVHKAALPHHAAPASVQNGCIPKDDQQRAVFLGIPTPKTSPRLIGPNAAKHGAHEAEK